MHRIQKGDFSVDDILSNVADDRAGAVVLFVGMVRTEKGLKALDYQAYDEMAAEKLEQLRSTALEKFKLKKATILHRKGRLTVGQKVVIVACSAPHRKEAFQACEWLISKIKKVVPIWKKEI